MEENHLKTMSFILKIVLLLHLVYFIHHQYGAEAAQPDLYHRMWKIEAENQRHENEILILMTERVENRKEIHQLRERVALVEDSTFSNSSSGEKILTRSGRPARLLPSSALRPRKKINENEEEEPKKFYGPPTSCDDLKKLGYTLNGYYLIKGKEKSSNANRIQVVYCQFYQPPGATSGYETWIGNVALKTRNVHFYVQRDAKFKTYGTLRFNVEQLNVGGAMNLTTGKFTAPVNGIYHFEFRCLKDVVPIEATYFLLVKRSKPLTAGALVRKVKDFETVALTYMANLSYNFPGSITASLKLRASDIVKLYSNNDVYMYDNGFHHTQFAGWLVEEDLILA